MDGRKPRKSGGSRSCFNKNGSPKAAFATKKLAERAIPPTSVGLAPYPCANHGWHIGHRRRRASGPER
ncbi:MAG: hypothetical protein WAJ85_12085 [Candidatus Baltobacteraceae bacterium]